MLGDGISLPEMVASRPELTEAAVTDVADISGQPFEGYRVDRFLRSAGCHIPASRGLHCSAPQTQTGGPFRRDGTPNCGVGEVTKAAASNILQKFVALLIVSPFIYCLLEFVEHHSHERQTTKVDSFIWTLLEQPSNNSTCVDVTPTNSTQSPELGLRLLGREWSR